MSDDERHKGRPRLYDDDNPNPNVIISIYCCSSTRDALYEEAARCGVRPGKLGAEALRVFLSAREKTREYLGISGEYAER